jgi:hypothetical protein
LHKSEIPEQLRIELRKHAEKVIPIEHQPEPGKDVAQRSSSAFNFIGQAFAVEEKLSQEDLESLDSAPAGEFEWSWIKEGEPVKVQVPKFEPLEDEKTNTKTHTYVCSVAVREMCWDTRKRFSQFEKLWTDLEEADADGCNDMIFPSKSRLTFGILGDDGLEQRRKDLDRFMRSLMSRMDLLAPAAQAVVWHFLNVHRYFGKQSGVKNALKALKEREALEGNEPQSQSASTDEVPASKRKESMFDTLGSLFDSSPEQQPPENGPETPAAGDEAGSSLFSLEGTFLSAAAESPTTAEDGVEVAAARKDSVFEAFGGLFADAPGGSAEESIFNSFLLPATEAEDRTQDGEARAGGGSNGGSNEANRSDDSQLGRSEARTALGSTVPAPFDKVHAQAATAAAGGSPRTTGQLTGTNETTSVAGEGDTSERSRVCTNCFARIYERPILRYGAHFKEAAMCWLALAVSVWTDYVQFARVAQRGLQPQLESQKQRLLKLQCHYFLMAVRRFAPLREQAVAVMMFEALDIWKGVTFTKKQLEKLELRPMNMDDSQFLPENNANTSLSFSFSSNFSGPSSLGFPSSPSMNNSHAPAPPTLALSVSEVGAEAGDGAGSAEGCAEDVDVQSRRRRTAADQNGNSQYERASAILAYRNLVRRSKSMTAVGAAAGGDFHSKVQSRQSSFAQSAQSVEGGAAAAGEGPGADDNQLGVGDLALASGGNGAGGGGGGTARRVSGSGESAMMRVSNAVASLNEEGRNISQPQWINNMLHVWWPYLKHAINQKIINKVNSLLETQSPPFVSSIHLSRFDLGDAQPYIASIEVSSNGIQAGGGAGTAGGGGKANGVASAGDDAPAADSAPPSDAAAAEPSASESGSSSSTSSSSSSSTTSSSSSSTDGAAGGEGIEKGAAAEESAMATGEGSSGQDEKGAGGGVQSEADKGEGLGNSAAETTEEEEQLVIDITFGFKAGTDQIAELSIMTDAGFETTVSVQNIVLHPATARIVMHPLKTAMPCFGGVSACFMAKPSIEFDFNFSGLAVTSLPFVAEWLQGFIKNSISSGLIFPQFKHFSTTPAAPAADTEEAAEERDVAKTYVLTIKLGEGSGFEDHEAGEEAEEEQGEEEQGEEEQGEEEQGEEEQGEEKDALDSCDAGQDSKAAAEKGIEVEDDGATKNEEKGGKKKEAKPNAPGKAVKTMTVRVPPGTSVGDELTVTTSDGRMVNVVIPEGAKVGQKFKVRECLCTILHNTA